MSTTKILGIVVIGRNEGDRLVRCLNALNRYGYPIVYVDSGSSDGSFERAKTLGAHSLALDMSRPFTAARARNAGFAAVKEISAGLVYVQFIDGDCELVPEWIPAATAFLDAHPDVAVACGRLRERRPTASIYNQLCDIEWNTPVGETKACGGIAMMRVAVLEQMNGFRETLIAGEEPELCVRIRAAGWKVYRMPDEMGLHDAAMTRFSQWWKRAVRAGYAYAEGASLHGAPPERHWVRESRRSLFWGAALPTLVVSAAALVWPAGLAIALIYPLQFIRLALQAEGSLPRRLQCAFFLLIGKFPEAFGHVRFAMRQARGAVERVIEYK